MAKVKLTAQFVKGIRPPKAGRLDYRDETQPGLCLRVTSSGLKSYSVVWWGVAKAGDRPANQRVTLGLDESTPRGIAGAGATLLTLAEARKRAAIKLTEFAAGRNPAAEVRERKAAKTFRELGADFLEHHAFEKKTRKGAREDQLRIENVLLPRLGAMKAGEVRRGDLVELLDVVKRERGPIARNRTASLLSKMFNFAIDRDLYGVERNPALRLTDRDLEKARKRPLSDAELRVILPLFRAQGIVGLGFLLIALTGCRPIEVFGARWSEFDLDAGLWRIPRERLKQRRSRACPEHHVLPLSVQARKVVNELRSYDLGTGFVFPSRVGRPGGKSKRDPIPCLAWDEAARRVRAASGITPVWELYDLRSTVADGLERLRFAPHVISAVLCHILDSVTGQHYQRGTYDADKAEALAAWGDHLAALDPSLAAGKSASRSVVSIRARKGQA